MADFSATIRDKLVAFYEPRIESGIVYDRSDSYFLDADTAVRFDLTASGSPAVGTVGGRTAISFDAASSQHASSAVIGRFTALGVLNTDSRSPRTVLTPTGSCTSFGRVYIPSSIYTGSNFTIPLFGTWGTSSGFRFEFRDFGGGGGAAGSAKQITLSANIAGTTRSVVASSGNAAGVGGNGLAYDTWFDLFGTYDRETGTLSIWLNKQTPVTASFTAGDQIGASDITYRIARNGSGTPGYGTFSMEFAGFADEVLTESECDEIADTPAGDGWPDKPLGEGDGLRVVYLSDTALTLRSEIEPGIVDFPGVTGGLRPYTYQWRDGGGDIVGQTTHALAQTGLSAGTSVTRTLRVTDAASSTLDIAKTVALPAALTNVAETDAAFAESPLNWYAVTGGRSTVNPGAYVLTRATVASGNGLLNATLDCSPFSGVTATEVPVIGFRYRDLADEPAEGSVWDGIEFTRLILPNDGDTAYEVTLASDLPAGDYEIQWAFLATGDRSAMGNRWDNGTAIVHRVVVLGYDYADLTLSTPETGDEWILYGDSTLEGVEVNGVNGHGSAGTAPTWTNDASKTYGWRLAERFRWHYGVVGFSSQGYNGGGYGQVGAFPAAHDEIIEGTTRSLAGLDGIYVAHGTNPATSAQVQTFLGTARTANATAPILQVVPPGVTGNATINADVEDVRTGFAAYQSATPDAAAYLIDLGTSHQTALVHPTVAEHAALADLYEPLIAAALAPDPAEGSAAIALAPLTSAASGTSTVTGSASASLGEATVAASGTSSVTGSASVTLSPLTSTAAGGVPVALPSVVRFRNPTLSRPRFANPTLTV